MSTTRPSRTQAERREQTRGRLIEQTIHCIAEHGYRATTNRRVAHAAGVSLGALTYHYPSRLELVAASLDEVGQGGVRELRARADAIDGDGPPDTIQILDLLWDYLQSDLFTVWIKVWLAAAEDHELYTRLAPIEARLNEAIATVAADLAPADLNRGAWLRRLRVAGHAMRGLALSLAIEPRERRPTLDPWPATRDELAAMIDRQP
jgi:AcrR family transcriptional regulator